MKINFRKYYFVLMIAIVAIISSCSDGNKVIPDNNGNLNVDTTNTELNSFKVFVTGDTTFTMNITTADTSSLIKNDSLLVSGAALSGTSIIGLLGFKTFASVPNSYLTEGSPPGITQAAFGFLATIKGVRRLYAMNRGSIIITEHDLTAKTVKGSFDVNNEYNLATSIYLRCKGYFYIKYK